MDAIHDLGGMHGFGLVEPEPDEPVPRALGAAGVRHDDRDLRGRTVQRRSVPPRNRAHGAGALPESSYYEHWLAALETLLVENGALTQDELEARRAVVAGVA